MRRRSARGAHDFNPSRAVGAAFQALPGASFVVGGAAQASDSVLTTASAEWKWLNGWSAAATFEGEFSNVTQSYAGKGVARYAWRAAQLAQRIFIERSTLCGRRVDVCPRVRG